MDLTIEGPSARLGKWGDDGVPQRGWTCTGVADLGEPSAVCEMCEAQAIRFVHEMSHPFHPDVLRCGCICAGHMESDLGRAVARDTAMRATARKRQAWPDRVGWARTRCGHATIKTEGYEVTLFPRGGEWGGKLVRLRDRDMTFMRRTYPTERAAKLASFDVLQFVRAKRGEAA